MCIERAVIFGDSGVVAADDQMRAAEILAEERMEQSLARSGVAHVERIARLHHGPLDEVVFRERCYRARPHVRRNIAGLYRTQQ